MDKPTAATGRACLPAAALFTALFTALAALLTLGACGLGSDDAAPGWVNPDGGSAAAPVTLEAGQLPYRGAVTGGIHYLRIVGLAFNTPHFVTVSGKRADADLFVFGDGGFTDYQCGSVLGSADDDLCGTLPLPDGVLHVEVYGYEGNATPFLLDVW